MNLPADTVSVSGRTRPHPDGRPHRILITNDDGVESAGIQELAATLGESHEVIVVAPADERSGAGTGIGYFDPTRGVSVEPTEVGGQPGYALAGPPGLAVMSAMLGAYGDPPDLVVSGINAGMNTGHSVLHSGTVGAVLTARTFGCGGVAVSAVQGEEWRWDTAAKVAAVVVDWVCGRERLTTLNLNVPACDLSDLAGLRWADLDEFGFFRVATADVPGRNLQFEVGAPDSGLDPASDTALLREGHATITPLMTIEPAPFPDGPGPELPQE